MARNKEPWRRDHILDAALKLLSEGNTDQLRIANVAQAAGVSTASVHYHFGDLGGLVRAAMDLASSEMVQARQDELDSLDDATSRLKSLIAHGVPDAASPALIVMYTSIGLQRADPTTGEDQTAYLEGQISLYESVIQQGINEQVFTVQRPTREIASDLVALEDAYDLYLVIGVRPDGRVGRKQIEAYASASLGVDLS